MKHLMIAVAALFIAGACRHKVSHAHLSAGSGDRQVVADVDGPAWIFPAEDKITVNVTGHAIVIEKERLLLDGKERAKIPAAAKQFEVVVSNATLRVTADSAEVLATTIQK